MSAEDHAPSRLARLMLAIEDISRRHYRLVIILAIGVFLLGTAISLTLHLQTDMLELLPQRNPAVKAFRYAAKTFGALDSFPVMIDAPAGEEADDYEEFADHVSARLRRDPLVASVDSRFDLDSPMVHFIQERLPLFLDPADIEELKAHLGDEGIRKAIADDRQLVEETPFPEMKEFVLRDPLQLAPLMLRRFASARGSSAAKWSGGYLTSKDGRALLIVIHPSRPAQDTASAATLVQRVKEAIATTQAESANQDPTLPAPTIYLGGRYVISVEDASLILSDIGKTITLSFVGVVALYLFCYRRFGAVLYSVLPLMLGQCLTFALARLVYGSLSSATATSAALLMGLGTDFTIVMYARYVEERRAGQDMEHASRKMMGEAALGVYTGALTSAGTFGALMATGFVGLRQFGFLVGAGILLCLVVILLLLPALVVAFEGRRRARPPKLYVHSFGLEALIPLSRRHPKVVLAACGLLTAAAVPLALRLRLSESINDLRARSNVGIASQQAISERFGTDPNFTMVLTHGTDEAETQQRARRVEAALAAMRRSGTITRVEGLGTLVPDPRVQQQLQAAIAAAPEAFDPVRVERTLRDAVRKEGMREESFEPAIALLTESLRPHEPVTPEDLIAHGGGDFVNRFLRRDKDGTSAVSYVFGSLPADAVAQFQREDPTVVVTGVQVLSRALKATLRHDVVLCLTLGFLLVGILLVADFGSLRLALLPLIQLVIGLAWMLGAMGLFQIKLTMVNAFATALLLGVGIDYGIHILHRLRGPDAGSDEAIRDTGKAVAMAAMTNVVGFGVLLLSNYPGLRGLGAATVMGSAGCLLAALTLLPALERIMYGTRTT